MNAVQKGIEWLDANAPADWRSKINFETLDVSIWSKCILGQVFGIKNLTKVSDLKEHGFTAHGKEEKDMMFALWKEALNGN